jgi:hypothetical protein
MNALINRDFLRYCSYTHSVVYSVLLWAAISGRENLVAVLGWVHGIGWILMSLLCLEAVRRRVIPTWLGVMVAVIIGFYLDERKIRHQGRAPRPAAEKVS